MTDSYTITISDSHTVTASQLTDTLERLALENFATLQDDNESLQEQVKKQTMAICTYQDENDKFERDNAYLLKQIAFFREKAEEISSSAFLKTHSLSNALSTLKQEMNELTKKNESYKQKLNKQISKYRILQTKNNELMAQNIQHKSSIKELKFNEEALSKTCCQQTAELMEIKATLADIQSKYDKLCAQHSDLQSENEKLNETLSEGQVTEAQWSQKHRRQGTLSIKVDTPRHYFNGLTVPLSPCMRGTPRSVMTSRPASARFFNGSNLNTPRPPRPIMHRRESTDMTHYLLAVSPAQSALSTPRPVFDFENEYKLEKETEIENLKNENKDLLQRLHSISESINDGNSDESHKIDGSDCDSMHSMEAIKKEHGRLSIVTQTISKRERRLSKIKLLGQKAKTLDLKSNTYCSLWVYTPKTEANECCDSWFVNSLTKWIY